MNSADPFLKIIKRILSDKDNKKGTLVRIGWSLSIINIINILMKYLTKSFKRCNLYLMTYLL